MWNAVEDGILFLVWYEYINILTTFRISRPKVFCEKGVLRNFTKFTGKHRLQSFFFNKVATLFKKPVTLLKERLWHRRFLCCFHRWLLLHFYRLFKRWSFPLRISQVNMTEPALNGHIYLNNTAFSCRFVEIYDHSVEIWTHLLKNFNRWIHFLCSAMVWYFFHGMNVSIYWWQYYSKSGYR